MKIYLEIIYFYLFKVIPLNDQQRAVSKNYRMIPYNK